MNESIPITERKNLRSPSILFGGLAAVMILWLLAIYPLTPSSMVGWCSVLLAGVAVFLWLWVCIEAILWLERPRPHRALFKCLGFLVALSLGASIFGAAYFARDFLSLNFSYFFRSW